MFGLTKNKKNIPDKLLPSNRELTILIHVPKSAGSSLWTFLFQKAQKIDPKEEIYFIGDSFFDARNNPDLKPHITDIDRRLDPVISPGSVVNRDRFDGALRESEAFDRIVNLFCDDGRQHLIIHCHSLPMLDLSHKKVIENNIKVNLIVLVRKNEDRVKSALRHLASLHFKHSQLSPNEILSFKRNLPLFFNGIFFRGYSEVAKICLYQENRNINISLVDYEKLISLESNTLSKITKNLGLGEYEMPIIQANITDKVKYNEVINDIFADPELCLRLEHYIKSEDQSQKLLKKIAVSSDF